MLRILLLLTRSSDIIFCLFLYQLFPMSLERENKFRKIQRENSISYQSRESIPRNSPIWALQPRKVLPSKFLSSKISFLKVSAIETLNACHLCGHLEMRYWRRLFAINYPAVTIHSMQLSLYVRGLKLYSKL